MNLARMMTDKFFIENQHGVRSGPFKTKFGSGTLMVFQEDISVAEGDRIIQPLPDGSERAYRVEGYTRNAGSRNVPAHFAIRVSEAIALYVASERTTREQHAPVAAGIRDSSAGIAASMQSLALAIDGSGFPAADKEEALSLLHTLLAHPVVAALLSDTSRTA